MSTAEIAVGVHQNLPRYDELPEVGETGERSSWNVFGEKDDLGCLNFQTAESVRSGAAEVRSGTVVNLNLPVGEPQPQFWASRAPYQHRQSTGKTTRDEYIDSFNTQGGTQIDGFGHHRFRGFGYYGGRQDSDLDDGHELGIEVWAERGIAGRAVLADVAAYLERQGRPMVADERLSIDAELLRATLDDQGTQLRSGDMLLVRTGWLGWYQGLDEAVRTELATLWNENRQLATLPGISPSADTAAWLWNSQVSLIAVDNPTAEAIPYRREEGWAHHRLLVLLGLPLGELWSLDALAERCREQSQWSFFVSVAPLNLPHGVASPANAYAVL